MKVKAQHQNEQRPSTPVGERAGGVRTDVEAGVEPRRSDLTIHVVAAERREPQRLMSGEYEPDQEADPKLSDSIDEGLARSLPLDDDSTCPRIVRSPTSPSRSRHSHSLIRLERASRHCCRRH
jgi:hypothetical protein